NELSVERLADAHVYDLTIVRERGDRTRRRSERADVLVRKRRRHRWWRRMKLRNDCSLLTGVAHSIFVDVFLVGIRDVRTVIPEIRNSVMIAIGWRGRRFG